MDWALPWKTVKRACSGGALLPLTNTVPSSWPFSSWIDSGTLPSTMEAFPSAPSSAVATTYLGIELMRSTKPVSPVRSLITERGKSDSITTAIARIFSGMALVSDGSVQVGDRSSQGGMQIAGLISSVFIRHTKSGYTRTIPDSRRMGSQAPVAAGSAPRARPKTARRSGTGR